MKLGVLTNLLGSVSLEEALQYFSSLGLEMVEIGCGGFPGKDHADPDVLLNDDKALADFKALLEKYNVEISALSCHGNPVHPDKAIAKEFDEDMRKTVLLAEKLGVHQINTFSGCPGDCENSKYPNWVTCPWPEDFLAILDWQWNEVLIPYWKKTCAFAEAHNVKRIAFEMHPGFCVYNPETLLRLRAAVGPVIGANFDPSHLIWQGMDPVAAIRELKGCIYHVHAKDTKIVTCHLGNGSSIAAVNGGKCVDTSMGLTPLAGIMMGTRTGDMDPSVLKFCCSFENKSVDEMMEELFKETSFKEEI